MNTQNIRFRSNRVRDIVTRFHSELDPLYGSAEVDAFCAMLCEAFLGWDRVQLLLSKDRTIDQSVLLRFHWALEDLGRHRPVQHIIGHVEFCGCHIEVNSNVLIPRPETEEMVRHTLGAFSPPQGDVRMLDLCTGSGCIALALKRACPMATVVAVDLSPEALAVAQHNAERNGLEVNYLEADLLDPGFAVPGGPFALIVSNPPYVRSSERLAMQPNVLDYEPHSALFVPDADPLRFYRPIASFAERSLVGSGMLVVEINEALSDATAELLRQHGFRTTLHHDFRLRPRFLTAVRG